MYFEVINKQTKQQLEVTRLCIAHALREYERDLSSGKYPLLQITTPHAPKDSYLFLIRAYNESTMIGVVIDEIVAAGFTKIIICNDGSSDSTESVVEQKAKEHSNVLIVCLSHLINRGPGAANKTLFAFATKFARSL